MISLISEWTSAVCELNHGDRMVLQHHRIERGECGHPIGACNMIFAGQRWEPDPFSEHRAFVLPVLAWGGTVDLLAFHPMSDDWFLRTGAATTLGRVETFLPDVPTRVFRTPLSWLVGGCQGICLLTHDPAEQQAILLSLRAIRAEDIDHTLELQRILKRPPANLPEITAA